MRCVVDTNVIRQCRRVFPFRSASGREQSAEAAASCYSPTPPWTNWRKFCSAQSSIGMSAERNAHFSWLSSEAVAEFVPIIQVVRECRDPKDDKFLEVALNGRADVIITGDADLLRMHPWREIAIFSPVHFLRNVKS